ncbi:MAG TPA: creatininase family protein [Gemmatimonadaceae bacterium]|nr:creatininase family protein [Gemmatimonadaceae bacterium]
MTPPSPRPWLLAELTLTDVRAAQVEVAVIPLGATEPHNLHLPYGTDVFEATILGEALCAAAHGQGAKVVLLPTIPFGVETNMREFPLAININPETLNHFVRDIVRSLRQSGIRKIVLLNSHGGNEFKPLLRELAGEGVQLFLIDWFRVLNDVYSTIFEQREDHAGEMETSFALAYFPHLVRRNADGSLAADDGGTRQTAFDAVNKGWVSITRPWHLLTTNSGSGNPHAATADKGRQCMALLVQRLSAFLVELSEHGITENFPYEPRAAH